MSWSGSNQDRSYNPYGMDFGALEYDSDAEPDPMDAQIAVTLRLSNEEHNRRTGKNEPLGRIQVSNVGGGIRMFSEPGPDPRFMTFDFPEHISTEQVEAFEQHIRRCGRYSLASPTTVPSPTLENVPEKCKLCNESPCILNLSPDGVRSGRTLHEFLFEKGDSMMEQGIANIEIRYALYRDATTFINGYLGKGNRKELPACVVGEIRDSYPAKGGNYTGFKKGFLEKENK